MRTRRTLLLAAAAPWLLSELPAQYQPLAPTSNTSIATSGPLHYSSILIPAGVTVSFTGTAPAIVLCDGDCIVHGTLSAAATGTADGPGAVTLGIGTPGSSCPSFCHAFGCSCWGYSYPTGSGVHHGAYGSPVPFSLEGGSPGGSTVLWANSNPFWFPYQCCDVLLGLFPGGGGGGTLVVIAEGRVDIDGIVDVSGSMNGWPGVGSAGSLLLRGAGGTLLRQGGQLLAGPVSATGGYVRLDSWGGPPLVQGSILAPAPTVLELPHLRVPSPPRIGSAWSVDVLAPASSLVLLAASLLPGASTPTPFGTLEIDSSSAVILASAMSPTGSHDPRATIPLQIPNTATLLGLPLWLQALAVPATLSPRLTNGAFATVQ